MASDDGIEAVLCAYAQQRAEFARELEREVLRLGGTPRRRGSVAGALHRAPINSRASISGHDAEAVIAEAERGEDAATAA